MAYAHRLGLGFGSTSGFIEFNIDPDYSNYKIGVGSVVTISGQAKWNYYPIKSIGVEFMIDGGTPGHNGLEVAYVNKSISKGATGTFSISFTLTETLLNTLNSFGPTPDVDGTFWVFLDFYVYNATGGDKGAWTELEDTSTSYSDGYNVIIQREHPWIRSVTNSDLYEFIIGSSNTNPYDYYGKYLQSISLPRFSTTFETDYRDEKLTADHYLVLPGITISGKNFIYGHSGTVQTNGLTFTTDSNGKVTVNGTATADTSFRLNPFYSGGFPLNIKEQSSAVYYSRSYYYPIKGNQEYVLSGCPSGGSQNTYNLSCNFHRVGNNGPANVTTITDTGAGYAYSFTYNVGSVRIFINIANGTVCNNLEFYPQLEIGSSPTTYECPTYGSINVSTGEVETSTNLDLPVIEVGGDIPYNYTVVDSSGNCNQIIGGIDVFEYSPPSIAVGSYEMKRYKTVIDVGDVEAADGTKLWLFLDANISQIEGNDHYNQWSLTLEYKTVDSQNINTQLITSVTGGGNIVYEIGGDPYNSATLYDDYGLDIFSAAFAWECTIVLSDLFGTIRQVVTVPKASAFFDVEPYGVSVGMRSQGAENEYDSITGDLETINKKFEVAEDYESDFYGPAVFHNDVSVAENGLLKVVGFTAINAVSVSAGAYQAGDVSLTTAAAQAAIGDGWTPLCVAGWWSSTRYCVVWRIRLSDDGNTIFVNVYNPHSSAHSITFQVFLLCVRTGI